MILDFELTDEEVAKLDIGGIIMLVLPDGLRVIIKKDKKGE